MTSSKKKKNWFNRMNDWLSDEQGALERGMEAAQEQPAAPDVEKLTPAEERWAKEELEEEARIEAAMNAWAEEKALPFARALYNLMCVGVCLTMIALLLFTVTRLPAFGSPEHPINNEVSARYIEKGLQETGAVNIVTGMILDYRAFDTLGESSVLFTAAMVVLFLLRKDKDSARYSQLAENMEQNPHSDTYYEPKNDIILQKTAVILVPIVMLLGIYVILNGHLSPGGGFSGGAIMGAGLILYVTAFGFAKMRRFFTYKTYQRIVLVALLTYAVSKCYSFYTGANHIASVIPLGTPGAILSSGLILVLNICVGFIVTCTMYCFYAVFRKGEL
ncbi:MAG: hydrogen gas-evolving membrane-bound hydrogenase subunit E [Christensenellales bacterium]|nr:hydrogen gas-evolving membrane-bound hydrogenase subunit E [Christensenellales bacterium]